MTKTRLLLPDAAKARGYRDGVRGLAEWELEEIGPNEGLVEQNEGSEGRRDYFRLHRLCDAGTAITPATWDILRQSPGVEHDSTPRTEPDGEPDSTWRQRLMESADKLGSSGKPGADIEAIRSTVLALPVAEVPEYLTAQLPPLFEVFPEGSLWFLEVDHLLVRRMSLMRTQLMLRLAPDVLDHAGKDGEQLPQLHTLEDQSLTSGANFAELVDPLLLIFTPASLGFCIPWMPHAFVFLSGMAGSLVEPRPPTLASIFGPRSDPEHGFHWKQSSFWKDIKIGQTEALLQWWATRLNVIYRHMLNPARFQNEDGWFEPERQTAWYLTIERMLADSLAISSVPQHSPLIRQQFAFDLLDKLETLFGFNETGSPLYFQKLLDRKLMVPRLARAWSRLPIQAQHRFNAQTEHLYDAIYKDARDHTYAHRLTTKGVKITDDSGRLLGLSTEDYVGKLFRALRNSSHGFLRLLVDEQRHVVAPHDGHVPAHLADLATILAFAAATDAEALCAGEWL